jgi:hypothetical protein
MFLQCVSEVVHVVHVSNFYAGVIYHKAECDALPDMSLETRCVLALLVPFGQGIFQVVDCKYAGLGKPIHPLLNLDVNPTIRSDNVAKVVVNDDFGGGDVEMETHVFRVWHGGVEVEIGKVDAQKLSPQSADCGIDEEIGHGGIRH